MTRGSGRRNNGVPTRLGPILCREGEAGRSRIRVNLLGMRRDIGWTRRGPRTEVDTSESSRLRNRAVDFMLVVFDGLLELFQDLQVVLARRKLERDGLWR